MNILVDAMFGRLAKWLRMSGYDTIYNIELDDDQIIKIAKKEDRVIITRDRDLYRRANKEGINSSFIKDPDFQEQLKQITLEYDIKFKDAPVKPRCPICNNPLKITNKKDIKAKIPKNVGNTHERFWSCSICDKVYWQGGHWKKIKEMVKNIQGKSDD